MHRARSNWTRLEEMAKIGVDGLLLNGMGDMARKHWACSLCEAGTHRSKGLGMSLVHAKPAQ
jgi:hypothetical protein